MTFQCEFCGRDFYLENGRHLQEIAPNDWVLVCTPCLDATEVEAGK